MNSMFILTFLGLFFFILNIMLIFKTFYIHFKIKQKNLDHLKEHEDLLDRLDTPGTPEYRRKVKEEIEEQNLYYKRVVPLIPLSTVARRKKNKKPYKRIYFVVGNIFINNVL